MESVIQLDTVNSTNGKNITLMHHIKRSLEKDHMIILIDAESDRLNCC